ncbi:hypothetical protein [Salinisphaera orenii]|uniref:hypothetical protein n=1 Tax=Salinisphaera orenii TaxID=856731 RepID=UPI001C844EB8|nr:hypothetical protein [Salinisphaera orenii]
MDELKDGLRQSYQQMLDEEQGVLSDISDSLEKKLKLWANPSAKAKVLWKTMLKNQLK